MALLQGMLMHQGTEKEQRINGLLNVPFTINDRFQQKGIATKLYQTLFRILQFQGCRNVYAGITLPNEKSVHFHEKMGFNKIADYKNIGYKLDRWNTVRWYELQLNNFSDAPAPFIKWNQIEPKEREIIMNPIG
jgi:phosphinothricin acetyltransferase